MTHRITWSLNSRREATLFCLRCGKVFARNVPATEAAIRKRELCTG